MTRSSVIIHLFVGLLMLMGPSVVPAGQNSESDRALFWSIQKNGQQAGYLLGTIHSEDPRVLDFSEDFLHKLKENEVFAMEMIPNLPTLERLTAYMNYPPGKSLESVIGNERYTALQSALSGNQVPAEFLSRMKPWAAMIALSTPRPETGFFMDFSLSLRASGSGLELVGLETLEQQLSFLENMPMPMQLSLLDQAIAEYGQVLEVHDQMVDTYLENNLVALQLLSDEQLEAVGENASDYFMESGIHARNQRMAQALLQQLENKTVFVAVGALHLPGEEGLLNILRQHGFELSPQPIPFSESP
ncbi:MAG: TraB/GumN family protein [Xanthomonadales bacterium]|nr:TraB/GumN family protein [Xanthomonadales bacterium]